MINEFLKRELETLFIEKKYEEIIKISEEKLSLEEIPASLCNLIGICKIYKKDRSLDDIISSLSYFEQTYLKGKKTIHGLNGLNHLISIGIQFTKEYRFLSSFIIKAEKFYLESEKYFNKNELFLRSGLLLYSYFLDNKKQKKVSNQILKIDGKSKIIRSLSLFEQNYFNDWSQKDHFENAKINSKYFSKLNVKDIKDIDYTVNEKINIGFVSFDFSRNHPITFFIKNTIKYLDKNKFRVYIFSFAKKNNKDESQNELKNLSDVWLDVQMFNNQQTANLIQEKKINILFDVMGLTAIDRLEIFNTRVAPIQVSWLAYCNTLGFKNIDYIIADKNLIIEGEEKFYSERVIKLPEIWNSHSGFDFKRNFNDLPSLNNKSFTFGSFNNFKKISDDVINAWSTILQNIPNSQLILKSSTFCDPTILINKFKKKGVDHKIKILDKANFLEKKDHLKLYNTIDLALDTFPYNGVTTTFEALWMNVPVVVLKGYNFNSRCGESIISNSKLDYLIASNIDEYIQKAINLSDNKKKLIELRKQLYDRVLSTPLFDTQRFSKNFNNLLLDIFHI
jgi:predicted O-linked N-acetylglucosamine transferase (SPINDLY family)|tara:strand:- start:498 stop:2189 length:1692 start_codon:yes stop_codon:yes gene_type:complete